MDNSFSLKKVSAEQLSLFLEDLSIIEYFRGQGDVFRPFSVNPPETMLKVNAGMKEGSETEDRNARIARANYEILSEFHSDPGVFIPSSNMIRTLHRRLFQYSPVDAEHRGSFRADLSEELEGILDKLKKRINNKGMHVVLSVSIFRHEFLELMPFITANARLANLLSYFLLVQNNYSFVAHFPFLAYILGSSASLSKEHPFMLPHAIAHVLNHSQSERSEIYLNKRRTNLLESICAKGRPVKISDIMKCFPNESRNTIKKDLIYLRNNSLIAAKGEGRGMNYFTTPNNADNPGDKS